MTNSTRTTDHGSIAIEGILERRALSLWPGLDSTELSRCGGDPERVAALIAQHAHLSFDTVAGILVEPDRAEPPFYFG